MSSLVVKSSDWSALTQYSTRLIFGWMTGISAPSMSMNAPLRIGVTRIGARSATPMNPRRRSRLRLPPGLVLVKSSE
jgi:hypothetical protein